MTKEKIMEILNGCSQITFNEFSENSFEYDLIDNLPEDLKFDYDHGVTKVVLLFPETDFVVKIPFSGQEFPEELYDADNDEYYDGDLIYEPFSFAEDEEEGDDYCRVELLKYAHAVEADGGTGEISQFFAPTSFLGYINHHPIYAQPKCEIYSHIHHKEYSKVLVEETKTTCRNKNYNCFNSIWLTEVRETYGDRIFNKLCEFISSEGIHDLHSDNIGYLNGKPIIVDYSNFND